MQSEEPAEPDPPRWRRWPRALVAAGRWAVDVLRGHAWSRHLHRYEK